MQLGEEGEDDQIEEKLGGSNVLCCSLLLSALEGGRALEHWVFSQDLVMPALLSSHFLLISQSSSPAECRPWLLQAPVAGL